MKPLHLLSIIFVTLGLILAFTPGNTVRPYKISADVLLQEIKSGAQYVSPDEMADLIIQKDPSIRLIDVRPVNEFEKFSLPGAINIPLEDILSDEWTDILNQDVVTNILYSNGTVEANEAWMLIRQLGYQNNYVLKGGLNYFAETIINPAPPAANSPDEELARYEFRLGAGMALGGQAADSTAAVSSEKPKVNTVVPGPQKKKKKPAGGC